jgi:hypothetical protein
MEDAMKFTINSKKLGRTITFSMPGALYIFVDLNGKPGTLGNQICEGGYLNGSAIVLGREDPDGDDDQARFETICRRWYRAYLRPSKWDI